VGEKNMKLDEAKAKYVFYTEIDLGDGDFIKLKEPSIGDLDSLNKVDDNNKINELAKLFPSCLVDHSFYTAEDVKASNKDVYAMLRESGSLFMNIISTWMGKIPFRSRLANKET
jgi:hypothetical protein